MAGQWTSSRKWARIAIWLLGIETALIFVVAWVYYPISQRHEGDFLAMLSHRQFMQHWNGEGLGYGPIFALYDLALRPLSDMPAMRIMYVINLGLMGFAFWLTWRTFCEDREQGWELHPVLPLFLLVNFYPTAQLIRQNNIEITEFAFLALAFYAYGRGRDVGAGVSLGLAASAKIVPVLLFPYLAWRRRWKALAAAIATTTGAFAVVMAIKGLSPAAVVAEIRGYVGLPVPGQWINNQALSGFFHRIVSVPNLTGPRKFEWPILLYPELAASMTLVAKVLLIALVAAAFLSRSGLWPRPAPAGSEDDRVGRRRDLVELQIMLLALLLYAPYNHTHYLALSFPIFLIGLREGLALAGASRYLPIFAVGYLLLGFLIPLRAFDPIVGRYHPYQTIEMAKMYSLPFAGAMLALLGALAVHRQMPGRAARAR